MKIAAFYENIKTGAEHAGISMEEALTQLKEAGLENLYANYTVIQKDLPWLTPVMKELELGVEGLYAFLDFSHNPKEELYRDCIDLAVQLGGRNVLLLPGIILPDEQERTEELTENMRKGLETAAAYAEGTGVRVTLEDFDGPVAPYNCLSGMKWFMEHVKGLYCSFDTGNFVMYSEDSLLAFEALKSYIATVHVKDRSTSPINPGDAPKTCLDGSVVYPCPTGRGYIQIAEMVKRLKAMDYDGGLIAELYDCDPATMLTEIANSIKYLKSIL